MKALQMYQQPTFARSGADAELHAAPDDSTRTKDVERILDVIRPAMEADAGGVELVQVQEGTITVRLRGTCLACPSAGLTMKHGIERTLKERLPWVTEVTRQK
jgi:Fe-S cluster biogenesis protein NfuA